MVRNMHLIYDDLANFWLASNPKYEKRVYTTLQDIQSFSDSIYTSTRMNVTTKGGFLFLDYRIAGYQSVGALQDIALQMNSLSNDIPYSINGKYFDRNL